MDSGRHHYQSTATSHNRNYDSEFPVTVIRSKWMPGSEITFYEPTSRY